MKVIANDVETTSITIGDTVVTTTITTRTLHGQLERQVDHAFTQVEEVPVTTELPPVQRPDGSFARRIVQGTLTLIQRDRTQTAIFNGTEHITEQRQRRIFAPQSTAAFAFDGSAPAPTPAHPLSSLAARVRTSLRNLRTWLSKQHSLQPSDNPWENYAWI